MRQVPHYLVIGDGRLARHFQHYLQLLNLPVSNWHRKQMRSELNAQLIHATHILILISDAAIDAFACEYLAKTNAIKIHCSGSVVSEHAFGAHPLMSFSHHLYDLEKYQQMSFVMDDHAPSFNELLPGLPNTHAPLARANKARYHALCVLSGNFSVLLWQKMMRDLEKDFGLPKTVAHAYVKQITQNLIDHPETALTGPLVRGDQATIQKNIDALDGDAFQAVYESFVQCYKTLPETQT